MKEREYVKDSTRGKSLIRPVSYKGDAMVQVWIDSRLLATLSNWLDEKEFVSRHLSEVVKEPLRMLVEHLVETGEVRLVDDTGEARKLLERKYGVQLNPKRRGMKNVLHNLALSNKRAELNKSVRVPAEELASEAMETYDKLFGDKKVSAEELMQREKEAAEERDKKIEELTRNVSVGERIEDEQSAAVVSEKGVDEERVEQLRLKREREDREQIEKMKNAKPDPSKMVRLDDE